jgi:hypothetical protein
MLMAVDDPRAVAAVQAIRSGDVACLARLLAEHPVLVGAELGSELAKARTLLHVVTDWPGHFPNGPATVALLIAAGTPVNGRVIGAPGESPLHWAASSDDVAVLDALLDAGAEINALGAVIGGGTPLADATAFGQWNAARRLIERGARTEFWEEAALGLMDRLTARFSTAPAPEADEITHAFWSACHGGQQPAAAFLLGRGADRDWIGYDGLTPLDAAARSEADDLVDWLRTRGATSATDLPG